MGIFSTYNESPAKVGVWRIEETEDWLRGRLSPEGEELATLEKMPLELRRKEWLTARVLLGQLLNRRARITYDELGKPHLTDGNEAISISHSDLWVAVTLNESGASGIDIQEFTPKLYRIREKFMHPDELAEITENDLEKLTVYWCVKEAIYKCYGKKKLIFRDQIHLQSFEYQDSGRLEAHLILEDGRRPFQLSYRKLPGAMMAYVLNG